jgi:hypothetical protein
MIKFTNELHNKLVDQAEKRAANFNLRGKKKIEMQYELFLGAVTAIDFLNGTEESCISPRVYFGMIRGQLLESIKTEEQQPV